MKQSRRDVAHRSVKRRKLFTVVLATLIVAAAAITAIAKYTNSTAKTDHQQTRASREQGGFVNVSVGGKQLRVDALKLQQGPLSQDEAQQIADALRDNKSTAGLVEVRQPNGAVEMDLQGRFQDVIIARKNDDGSVSTACVNNPEAASAFLRSGTSVPETGPVRKALTR